MIDPRDKFESLIDEVADEVKELERMAEGNKAFIRQFATNQPSTRYTKETSR